VGSPQILIISSLSIIIVQEDMIFNVDREFEVGHQCSLDPKSWISALGHK